MFYYIRSILLILFLAIALPIVGSVYPYLDANGNLAQITGGNQEYTARLHEWDEENKLKFVLGDKCAAYYGYDGNDERVYKLTGYSG